MDRVGPYPSLDGSDQSCVQVQHDNQKMNMWHVRRSSQPAWDGDDGGSGGLAVPAEWSCRVSLECPSPPKKPAESSVKYPWAPREARQSIAEYSRSASRQQIPRRVPPSIPGPQKSRRVSLECLSSEKAAKSPDEYPGAPTEEKLAESPAGCPPNARPQNFKCPPVG